jgi:segregation and condensation protein B
MSKQAIEGILFVSKEPISLHDISKLLDEDDTVVLRWMIELINEYKTRGIHIRQVMGGFEMVTSPDIFNFVEKIVPKQVEHDLSQSQLETLAIIAYRQPVKRADIEKVKGKNPDYSLAKLIERDLIDETGDGYIVTDNFLRYFSLNDLKELPELKKLESEQVIAKETELEMEELFEQLGDEI